MQNGILYSLLLNTYVKYQCYRDIFSYCYIPIVTFWVWIYLAVNLCIAGDAYTVNAPDINSFFSSSFSLRFRVYLYLYLMLLYNQFKNILEDISPLTWGIISQSTIYQYYNNNSLYVLLCLNYVFLIKTATHLLYHVVACKNQ